jgi:hypothetical protein
MRGRWWLVPLVAAWLGGLACGSTAPSPRPDVDSDVVPRGDRLLGIDVSEAADGDYDAAFDLARRAGIDFTSLTVYWDDLDLPDGFKPEPDYLAIAESYYPTRDTAIALTVAPIDTNRLRVPAELASLRFDDPVVIDRFLSLLEFVDERAPELQVATLALGNEIDAALGTEEIRWAEYERFFEAVADRARAAHPEAVVGVKATYGGLTDFAREPLQRLAHSAGAVFVTYYAIGDDFRVKSPEQVEADIDRLLELYPGLPVYFLEMGCPSGEGLGSSEQVQADFVRAVFRAWDRHADRIRAVNFTWLTDASPARVQGYGDYYGLNDAAFLEFLATIGLRTYSGHGRDKAAFDALLEEASRRGW